MKKKNEKVLEKADGAIQKAEAETARRKVGKTYHAKLKKESGNGKKKVVASKAAVKRAPCLCGCGLLPAGAKSRFRPGHDMRMKKKLTNNKASAQPSI